MFHKPLVATVFLFFLGLGSALFASERESLHLHLLGATDRHAPVVLVLEVEGSNLLGAAVSEPYEGANREGTLAGNLAVHKVSTENVSWDGSRLEGSIAHGDEYALTLSAERKDRLFRGTFEWTDHRPDTKREISGEVHGATYPLPDFAKADHLTLYLRNPVPGSPDGGRFDSDARGVASIKLDKGQVQSLYFIDSRVHAASRHSRQSIPAVMAGGAVGYQVVTGPRGDDSDYNAFSDFGISGQLADGRLEMKTTHGDKRYTYQIELDRVGDLVFGHYTIANDEDHGRQEVAGYWGVKGHNPLPLVADPESPEEKLSNHLRWLLEVNPFGGGLFSNDMGLGMLRNTGSKDYNDPPYVGGFGPIATRAYLSMESDPLAQAQALMKAQRAGHFMLSHRVGPINLLPTYKTTFRPQYWMGRALVDLAVMTESDFWKARALEVADALRETQDKHGSWSYVSAGSGEVGTTLSRNDRSWDNVPRANGMWLDLLARIRTELGVDDYRDVEERAANWMRTALLEGATHQGREYLIEGRSDRSRPDDDGPTFYALYQLRYLDEWDETLFKTTIDWAERLLYEGDDRLLRARYDVPRGPEGMSTVGTMRMALIYLLAAEKTGNADYLKKAGILYHTFETMYRSENGIYWDSDVWDTPQVADWSYHAYAVLPAELADNLIDFRAAAKRMEEAGTPVPQAQEIEFPDIADQAAEAGPLDPGATATSGLPVRFEVDSGPATAENGKLALTGEKGIVWVTAYQDGDVSFIPALSVQRTFAVGEAAPPQVTGVETWTVNNRSVRVSWEESSSDNIVAYSVESSRDGGETWEEVKRVDEETLSHEVGGMKNGEERLFRVLAHNPSFASKPSEPVAGETHQNDFWEKIDFADITYGDHWTLHEDADEAPDGTMLIPSKSDRNDRNMDPAYSFSFTVEIEEPGRYDVHYYCWGNAGNNDSAFIRTGEQDRWQWISIGNQEWTWRQRGLEFDEPGTHTIHFGARQHGNNGPRIAEIIVTNTDGREREGKIKN
ncbi:MAG: fibronectin type III domain-containing protein [Opitutales bacterium]|nr:fibronectin type III domain-containing protein [Opitutales bacterium]